MTGRALEITDVLSFLVRQIGGSAAQSVYAAGGRRARIDQAYVAAEESLYVYAQSLVNAVGEVQTAMAVGRTTRELVGNLEERLREAHAACCCSPASHTGRAPRTISTC